MIKTKRMSMIEMFVLIAALLVVTTASAETAPPLSAGQTVYVPVYSHIYSGDREHPFYLAVTLSIRNTDPRNPISILAVEYFDTEGKLLRKYLEKPLVLKAMASTRYVVKQSDKAGGSGANFLVRWKADREVNVPIIESIMIGTQMRQRLHPLRPRGGHRRVLPAAGAGGGRGALLLGKRWRCRAGKRQAVRGKRNP